MEDLLPKKHYSCKARSGLSKHSKPMAGLIIHTVNYFQDETVCAFANCANRLVILTARVKIDFFIT